MVATFAVLLLAVAPVEQPPTEDAVATVLGNTIARQELLPSQKEIELQREAHGSDYVNRWRREYPAKTLLNRIKGRLLEKYKQEHNLSVTEAELAPYLADWKARYGEPDEEIQAEAELKNQIASVKKFYGMIVESRKIAKSLFEKYGGRVSVSSFGLAIPWDAEQAFLRDQQKKGAFTIHDKELARSFWALLARESKNAALSEKRAKEMFAAPDYLRK